MWSCATLAEGGADLVVIAGNVPSSDVIPAEYPDTRFVFYDPVAGRDNVSYMQFADNQSSYLAGVAAALTSRTGTIGFIGGMDAVGIWAFHGGFQAGAQSVDPNIEVQFEYLRRGGELQRLR